MRVTRTGAGSTSVRRPSSKASSPAFETGHTFTDPALLSTALTHSSLLHEASPHGSNPELLARDNEQLEFLGDAVLSVVVAEALFRSFPAAGEGDLTRLRAFIVSKEHLAAVAGRLDLGSCLRLGRGEERSGGRRKPALLADALEAVIAALYLDGGLAVAALFIDREVITPALPELRQALTRGATIGDYKSALQERLQASGLGQPRYVLKQESGPDHQRRFRIAVEIAHGEGHSRALAESEGTTKKRAQQDAARLALLQLEADSSPGSITGKALHER